MIRRFYWKSVNGLYLYGLFLKRQIRVVDDVLSINIGNGFYSYSRVLDGADFAFYDYYSSVDISVDEIIDIEDLQWRGLRGRAY